MPIPATPNSVSPRSAEPPAKPVAAVCPSCGYDRAGLPHATPCPECNAPEPIPDPDTAPSWLELFVRTLFRPRVLWAELTPRPRDGSLILSNVITAIILFASAALIFGGIPFFTQSWRNAGPNEALSVLLVGTFVAALITLAIAATLGPAAAISAVVIVHVVRAVAAQLVPVRSTRYVKPVVAHASFALIAWGFAAWAVVIFSGLVALILLATGAATNLESAFLIMTAVLNMAIAGLATLHAGVLVICGLRHPS